MGANKNHLQYNAEAARVLKELERRKRMSNIAEGAGCFPLQIQAMDDTARKKIYFMPRRSGKSTMIGVDILQKALQNPGAKFLYLGFSAKSAKNIMWKDIFEKEMKRLHIVKPIAARRGKGKHYFEQHAGIINLPNGSEIILAGLDTSPKRVNALIGGKYFMAVIDECQLITQDLGFIIEELTPGLSDAWPRGGGYLVLSGYPGTHMGENLWWKLTKQDEHGLAAPDRLNVWNEYDNPSGWKMFRWTPADNPHYAKAFAEVVINHKNEFGDNYMAEPSFRRQWLGQWVIEPGDLLYKYTDANLLANDPNHKDFKKDIEIKTSLLRPEKKWIYIAGVDLGWEDATAIVVGAYCRTDKRFYIISSEKFNHTLPKDIAAKLIGIKGVYDLAYIVIDTGSGGKMTAETLRQQYNLPIVQAEKQDREALISNFNSDLRAGLIKVIYDNNKGLIDEWATCVVDKKKKDDGIWAPSRSNEDHLADAARYAHHESKHHHSVIPDDPKPRDMADEMLEVRERSKGFNQNAFGDEPDYLDQIEDQEEVDSIIQQFRSGSNNIKGRIQW